METPSGEFITVSDASTRLNIPLPRLLRHLKKPQYREFARQEQRLTRTGMRTVTMVDAGILDTLQEQFSSNSLMISEQKHKQKRIQSNLSHEYQTIDFLNQLLLEKQDRIQDLTLHLNEIRGERDRLAEQQKWLQFQLEQAWRENERIKQLVEAELLTQLEEKAPEPIPSRNDLTLTQKGRQDSSGNLYRWFAWLARAGRSSSIPDSESKK